MALKHYYRKIFASFGCFFHDDYITGLVSPAFQRTGFGEILKKSYNLLLMT